MAVESPDMDLPAFFKGWFLFVGMVVMAGFAFAVFVVWMLLAHFGVVA